jgi:hypothetical protein
MGYVHLKLSKKIGLYTITYILKNLDYLPFSTILQNEHYSLHIKHPKQPPHIYELNAKEIFDITRCPTYLIQLHAKYQMQVVPLHINPPQEYQVKVNAEESVIDEVTTTTPALLQGLDTPAEYCCAMTNQT